MRHYVMLAAAASIVAIALLAPVGTASGQSRNDSGALISVDFRGGSAADYVAAVRNAADAINILVDPGLDEVPMPPLRLTSVSMETALELLEGRVYEAPTGRVRVGVRSVRNNPQETPTYHITPQVMGDFRSTDAGVMSIRGIIDQGIAADDVVDAIKTAIEVAATPTKADIRYHKETGLIIARGDSRQLAAMEEVIVRLGHSLEDRTADSEHQLKSAVLEIQGLTQRLAQLEQALQQREAELRETRRRLEDTQTLLDAERARRRDGG